MTAVAMQLFCKIKSTIFWFISPSSLDGAERFERAYYLQLQG
jgi:hypothetical protein